MNFNRLAFLAAAVLMSAVSAEAKTAHNPTLIYDCKTGGTKTNSLFTDEYQFAQDQTANTVIVLDPLIQAIFKKPIAGKIKRENAEVVVYGWRLSHVVNLSIQDATLDYTLTVHKATNRFDIIMLPLGYANTFENTGVCTAKILK